MSDTIIVFEHEAVSSIEEGRTRRFPYPSRLFSRTLLEVPASTAVFLFLLIKHLEITALYARIQNDC
jgi:hypothetical protein